MRFQQILHYLRLPHMLYKMSPQVTPHSNKEHTLQVLHSLVTKLHQATQLVLNLCLVTK